MSDDTPLDTGFYSPSSPRYGSKARKHNRLIGTVIASIITLYIFINVGFLISIKYNKLQNYQMNTYEKWIVTDCGYSVLALAAIALILTISIAKPYKLFSNKYVSIY